VPEDETSSKNCLHCEINDVVREHIEGQEKVDVVELAAWMGESLVELTEQKVIHTCGLDPDHRLCGNVPERRDVRNECVNSFRGVLEFSDEQIVEPGVEGRPLAKKAYHCWYAFSIGTAARKRR
jgi:hypothetical protein